MDVPPETLDTLSRCFLQSLSPDASARRAAESYLSATAAAPGFPLALLRLASAPAADIEARLAAAVYLKNHLRRCWAPAADSAGEFTAALADADRAAVKSLLLPVLLQTPLRVQPQLADALAAVAKHDFPAQWPSLLPDVVSALAAALAAAEYSSVVSVLSAANSLFLRFRHSYDTNSLRVDLKYCLDLFAAPLLEAFRATSTRLEAALATPATTPSDAILPMIDAQRLTCDIFYSLNSVELPEFFEDHMQEWMTGFHFYLTTRFPAVEAGGSPDTLRAAICENLQLYMEKNEDEFKAYLQNFATAVWGLLMTPSPSPSRDQLSVTAIRFLTTVATSVHYTLFGSSDTMRQICESIVFPNLRLRDEDEELFEGNFVEYVRRDAEGSDTDTLRRAACELLRGLARNYHQQVLDIVSEQVQQMLSRYAADPNRNWKEKDAAIYLASASANGAQYLVNVDTFYMTVVLPELQSTDVSAFPMLKAGALKFVTVFRELIPKDAALGLLPVVIKFLGQESNVVHSYAAIYIEKLLLIKDKVPVVKNGTNLTVATPRYGAADINPYVPQMLTQLFNAMQFPESQENQYLMKCLMRVLGIGNVGGDVAAECVARLATILNMVCNNPKNPVFNHYLFESIAVVIGKSGAKEPALLPRFEMSLFPVLQRILAEDITEFWLYACQIFAQLISVSPPPLSTNYMQLFQVLLLPETWKRPSSAPALVQLLQTYLQKAPNELNREGRLINVLEIFARLVYSKSTEELGFFVLNTVVENLSYEMIAPHINSIWRGLFERLQGAHGVKFMSSLLVFMSLVVVKHGHGVLVDSINAATENKFMVMLQRFWTPNLKKISGNIEVKLTAVASTKLICESPALLDASVTEAWGMLLDSVVTLLTRSDQNGVEVDDDVPEINETGEYSVSFARLHYAVRPHDDPLQEVADAKQFLVVSLAQLSAKLPGRFGTVIEKYAEPANRNALLQLCGTYNVSII